MIRTILSASIPLSLCLAIAGCGDDGGGGAECGEGTMESEGICVPIATGDGPADRRACTDPFGPVGGDALLVDASFEGADSDGSAESPFIDLQSAIDAAAPGQEIGIAPGTYSGDLTIEKALSLEGRCAAEVIVEGSVEVKDTGGVALRGITVQNGTPGILATNVQPESGAQFGLEIRFLRATMNVGAGIEMNASAVDIQDSEFTLARQGASTDLREAGSGVFVNNGSFFNLSTSFINMNGFMGVDVADATGAPAAATGSGPSKATATSPSEGFINMNGIIGNDGGGVRINGAASNEGPLPDAPLVQIIANDFASNVDFAVLASSSRVEVVGNNMVGAADSHSAVRFERSTGAISANAISDFPMGAIALESCVGVGVTANTLMNNTQVGLLSLNSDGVSIISNRIEGTKVASGSMLYASGHGIFIGAIDKNTSGRHDINANRIADNGGVGVAIDNVDVGDTERVMFSMLNNQVDRNGYAGITLEDTRSGEIFGNTLNANVGFGLRCNDGPGQDSRIFFDRNTVAETAFSTTPKQNGHALVMKNCHIQVNENTVEENARYGVLIDIQSSGNCRDNMFLEHNQDIVLQGSPSMNMSGNADTVDGPVIAVNFPSNMVEYDQDIVTAPPIDPGL